MTALESQEKIKEQRLLKRQFNPPKSKRRFIAYDLETTRIEAGTPTPLYITAYGQDFFVSEPIHSFDHLREILESKFLTPENNKVRFVAWNANAFDAYFIGKALLESDKWLMRPYLAGHTMRGIKVKGPRCMYEFLDGMDMVGMRSPPKTLREFLKVFAPGIEKLDLDFDKEQFDPTNPRHIEYAERDSFALFVGIQTVNEIVQKLTGYELQTTIGNLAIKYFQACIPEDTLIWRPPLGAQRALQTTLRRGGYCWVQRQYNGSIWKYDLNQAYAAAMRDAKLPSGSCTHILREYEPGKPGIYRCYLGRGAESEVPFYYRTIEKNVPAFTSGAYVETWLTNIELEHLIKDGWIVEIIEGYYWRDSFNMCDMVNELERLRSTDPGGPSGALGSMCKALGNNAYGKTLEVLDAIEYIFAKNCPKDFRPYMEGQEGMEHIFFRLRENLIRDYHQPQIGVFVTAHVRVVVREAALKNPETFLYADTDGVVFSCSMDHALDIDPKRYGAWKKETNGKPCIIIGKKVYYSEMAKAKGLRTKELNKSDFEKWFNHGVLPVQQQIQRQNVMKFFSGQSMFQARERTGTDTLKSTQAMLVGDRFYPIAY